MDARQLDNPLANPREPFQRGLVQVYTGDGKGKSTAALGLALRAAGYALPTLIVQFLKGVPYGELAALPALPSISVRQFGTADWVHPDRIRDEDRRRAQDALDHASAALAGGRYKLVILDEINVALDWGLVTVEAVLELIRRKPEAVELVLTGRHAPDEIVAIADLVTEMQEIKHPYQKGVLARCGIEF